VDNVGDISSEYKASSDYGDDDFDDETLLELDASINPVQGDDLTLVASPREANHEALSAPKNVEDDFGDLDDDFFDGAEDLVAEVEAKQLSENSFQGQRHDKPTSKGAEDDAYGDDFGDIDFDAFELAATQSASRPFSSNVRTAG
jgi:DNA replication ATP-dependent helicase Dna2